MLIFLYEAIKYQELSLYIIKGLSFDFPKNKQPLPQSCIFLIPKICSERGPFRYCHIQISHLVIISRFDFQGYWVKTYLKNQNLLADDSSNFSIMTVNYWSKSPILDSQKVGFLNFNFTRHEILDFSLFLVYLTRVQRRKKIRERIVQTWIFSR